MESTQTERWDCGDSQPSLVAQALSALAINVPYYRVAIEVRGGAVRVTFALYGGRIATWRRTAHAAHPAPMQAGGDLTTIPGVGAVLSKKLRDAGFHSLDALKSAGAGEIARTVGNHTARKIRDFLEAK